ncbi:MAG TPA: hypothetical protein ENK95_02840 [Campylobacterales bacterium]|nr:hypothetical protein [Campylobacterales bacterium]
MQKTFLILLLLVLLTGCSKTIKTWNNYQKEEYYGVLGDDTLPQTLTDKNATFTCKDMIYSSRGYTKKCYVKKETAPEINYWAERILVTSAMGLAETVENVVIIAFYSILGEAKSNSNHYRN